MERAFTHTTLVRLAPGADERALGGAITVALCGHWEHDGECRWPHRTTVAHLGDAVRVRTEFDAPAGDVARVRQAIVAALSAGTLVGPDGRENAWEVAEP